MKKKIFINNFTKNVITLFTGTTIAQIIPVALSPILTRIYGPEEFGIFALYSSLVAILSVVSTGRYELAIVIPKKDRDAINVAALTVFINISISLLLLLIFLVSGKQLEKILGLDELGFWCYFIPLSLVLLGVYQIMYYWFNRRKMYKDMSINKVTQQTGTGVSNLSLGFTSNGTGLIIGTIIGQILSLCIITIKFIKREKKFIKQVSKKEMLAQAKRFIDFPKYLTFAHTLNVTSSNISIILFTNFFSAVSVGHYSLTQRILRMPINLIGSSISDVFRQKAIEDINEHGNCKILYIKTFSSLFLLGIIPFAILYVISPWLFSFVFGSEWRIAGEYARLMTPMFFLQFIISPLSSLYIVMEKQKLDLILQVVLFILIVSALLIGFTIFNSIEISIFLFTLAYSLIYILNAIITYRLASSYKEIS